MILLYNFDMTDMHFIYDIANGNAKASIHQQTYPDRLVADNRTFTHISGCLKLIVST